MEKLPFGVVTPETVQLDAGAPNLTFGGNAVKLPELPNLMASEF